MLGGGRLSRAGNTAARGHLRMLHGVRQQGFGKRQGLPSLWSRVKYSQVPALACPHHDPVALGLGNLAEIRPPDAPYSYLPPRACLGTCHARCRGTVRRPSHAPKPSPPQQPPTPRPSTNLGVTRVAPAAAARSEPPPMHPTLPQPSPAPQPLNPPADHPRSPGAAASPAGCTKCRQQAQ